MPVYAFAPQRDNKPTSGESAVNLGNQLGELYGKYKQGKATEAAQATLNNPESTPMQQALAWAQLGQNQAAAQTVKSSGVSAALEKVNNRFGNLSAGTGGGGAQNVPGATPPIMPKTAAGATRQPPNATIPDEVVNANEGTATQVQPQESAANVPQGQPQSTQETPDQKRNRANQFRQRAEQYSQIPGAKQQVDADLSQAKSLENEARHEEDKALAQQKFQRDVFESERSNSEKRNEGFLKTLDSWRQSLPFSKQALHSAENAIRTGDFSALSRNNLASILGRPELKDAPAAQLDIALKQNLLDTISTVSAKFGNKWLEQVSFSAFPGYGRSPESNRTMIEALRGSEQMKQTLLDTADQISENDKKILGYEGPDFQKRVFEAARPELDKIIERTSYKTRSLYEDELSKKDLQKLASKSPPPGTPLTRKMYQVLYSKSDENLPGDQRIVKTIERAKKMGFVIYPNSKVREYTNEQQ